MDFILGCSGGPRGSHEPGVACISSDGRIIFVFEEERFNRFKSSISCFPTQALKIASETYPEVIGGSLEIAHPGASYADMKLRWPLYFSHNFGIKAKYVSLHHQMCHASVAYFSSAIDDALVVSLDGIGDKCSGVIAIGEGNRLKPLRFFSGEQSFGFFWSYICQMIGYDGLEDAYKTMGLAPYGNPIHKFDDLVSVSEGSIQLNPKYFRNKFDFISKHPSEPVYTEALPSFMDGKERRVHGNPITQFECDVAASAQSWLENTLTDLFKYYAQQTGKKSLCFAGGVALNSHFNGSLGYQDIFDNIYIPPCPGDSGLALGAAQLAYTQRFKHRPSPLVSPYNGSHFSDKDISTLLISLGISFKKIDIPGIVDLLASQKVIGLFHGRSETGPRALGNRSIIAAANLGRMKEIVNQKIKYRESYRPFAPVILADSFDQYFERSSCDLRFMSAVVKANQRAKDQLPAIVHVDGTSRVQIAHQDTLINDILLEYRSVTGLPALLNTSFNLKGEPNVETPKDAIRTFFSSGLDRLVLWPYIITKSEFL